MILKLIFILLAINISCSVSIVNPLATMNFTQYCQYFNYPVETHYITTDDGYILTFFRIQAKNTTIIPGLEVVYLQHGLVDSSDTFIINDEEGAPAFMAANRGYDVWLGNSRGNKYSLSHVNLTTNDPAFWSFSWQQMAEYDLPAAFAYISNQTQKSINYIGHSQGTTIMFASLSKLNSIVIQNLKTFCALGPITFVNHMSSNVIVYLADHPELVDLIEVFHVHQIFEPNWLSTSFASVFCECADVICTDILGQISDANPQYDSYNRMDIIMGHYPAGTSTMDLFHLRQMAIEPTNTSVMPMYDYGSVINMEVYGTTIPPNYDLTQINVPVHLFAGQGDKLADPQDVEDTKNSLINAPIVTLNMYPDMGHATFLWGKNMSYMNDVFAVIETVDIIGEMEIFKE